MFCAVGGVEPQSETVWRQADRYRVPRIAFINKCDRVGADPDRCVQEIRERLRGAPIVIQIPNGLEDEFSGVIDLIEMKLIVWEDDTLGAASRSATEIPAELARAAAVARATMIEAIAEADDEAMRAYLEERHDVAEALLRAALRRATVAGRAVPVLVRRGLQEQGRAAAARRGRRLPAVAARHAGGGGQGSRQRQTTSRAAPTTTSRSRRWRSRS